MMLTLHTTNYCGHHLDTYIHNDKYKIAIGSQSVYSKRGYYSHILHIQFPTPYVAKVFEQAVGPGVLQTFSTCAVKH